MLLKRVLAQFTVKDQCLTVHDVNYFSPSQCVSWTNLIPLGQSQMKPNCRSTHRWEQPPFSYSHSFTSTQTKKQREKSEGGTKSVVSQIDFHWSILPQPSSSLLSWQSLEWSHLHDLGTHCPLVHRNSDLEHTFVLRSVQLFSSAPSGQSALPSQMLLEWRQLGAATQRFEPVLQSKQALSSLRSSQWSTPSQSRSKVTHLPLSHENSSLLHFGKRASTV